MKNIFLLPTDKPSRLCFRNYYFLNKDNITEYSNVEFKNIYITNDEEIKEGDYMLLKYEHSHGRIRKCHYIYEEQLMIDAKEDIGFGFCKRNEVYKITLTTDQDLIKDGVQAIDDDFLEWFVKNPSCERVEVYEVGGKLFAEPIIPKEESRQETLEEAAERMYPIVMKPILDIYDDGVSIQIGEEDANEYSRESFIEGAKWQAERMYSEEDMKSFGKFCSEYDYRCFGSKTQEEMLSIWFEQFKKK